MTQIATWDATQTAMSLGAIQIVAGFGEGSFVKYAHEDAYWGVKKGADGSVTRYKIPAQVGKVKVTLLRSSIINDLLSARMLTDHNTPGGAGLGAFAMKDLNGTSLISAAHAFIEGPPEDEVGVEVSEREWTIVLMDAEVFFGGNPPQ